MSRVRTQDLIEAVRQHWSAMDEYQVCVIGDPEIKKESEEYMKRTYCSSAAEKKEA